LEWVQRIFNGGTMRRTLVGRNKPLKKQKIEVGQCYQEEGQNHVFMIIEGPFEMGMCHSKYWIVEDTINKGRWPETEEYIRLTCSRPFQNFG
jgi:hypothetical protein